MTVCSLYLSAWVWSQWLVQQTFLFQLPHGQWHLLITSYGRRKQVSIRCHSALRKAPFRPAKAQKIANVCRTVPDRIEWKALAHISLAPVHTSSGFLQPDQPEGQRMEYQHLLGFFFQNQKFSHSNNNVSCLKLNAAKSSYFWTLVGRVNFCSRWDTGAPIGPTLSCGSSSPFSAFVLVSILYPLFLMTLLKHT